MPKRSPFKVNQGAYALKRALALKRAAAVAKRAALQKARGRSRYTIYPQYQQTAILKHLLKNM